MGRLWLGADFIYWAGCGWEPGKMRATICSAGERRRNNIGKTIGS